MIFSPKQNGNIKSVTDGNKQLQGRKTSWTGWGVALSPLGILSTDHGVLLLSSCPWIMAFYLSAKNPCRVLTVLCTLPRRAFLDSFRLGDHTGTKPCRARSYGDVWCTSSTICIVGAKRIELIREFQFLSMWIHMINNLPKPRVPIELAGEVDIP